MLVDEGIRYHEDDSLQIGKARRAINPWLRRAFSSWLVIGERWKWRSVFSCSTHFARASFDGFQYVLLGSFGIELILTKIIHSVYTELLALLFVCEFVFEQFSTGVFLTESTCLFEKVKMIALFLYSLERCISKGLRRVYSFQVYICTLNEV